ncbi:MAG: GNAT family N-acetyltransferase, partial [Coriobacteriales bacterium]|nr:GNAT family N-acetyltransferase [Coriobacteriales bacterium]
RDIEVLGLGEVARGICERFGDERGVLAVEHEVDGYIKMNGVAVLPEYQGRGIGRQLLERSEAEARERGVNSVGCATSFGREGSQAMLAKAGYERSAYWYHKVLHG